MSKRIPIFYSALLLTCVNLLLRLVGTTFQVYISGRIGPAGVGLLQLVLSVGNLAMVAGIGGIRTATMYLAAEELGRKRHGSLGRILSACFLYSILFSGTVAAALYGFAPRIAEDWIGDGRTVSALRQFAAFLPISCLCGVMTGFFTAENRIGTLAAVEVLEQLCSVTVTMAALTFWAGQDSGRACLAVVFGSGCGACVTLLCLTGLRVLQKSDPGPQIPVAGRLLGIALPLAAADVVKSGVNTLENLMVPRRLARNVTVSNPLAAFGIVSGMVFPVMMFPACILFALAELLIPELARCAAAGSKERIAYLTRRSLKVAMLYGILFGGVMFLSADRLCMALYGNPEAGRYLKLYSIMIPMLYCDAVTDAMSKGLGQQKICVRYNILTSVLDVVFLYLLLPRYGMDGYFFSFLVTHLLNFLLSLRLLMKTSGAHIPAFIPMLSVAATLLAVWAVSPLSGSMMQMVLYPVVLGCLLTLFQVTGKEDLRWIRGVIAPGSSPKAENAPS